MAVFVNHFKFIVKVTMVHVKISLCTRVCSQQLKGTYYDPPLLSCHSPNHCGCGKCSGTRMRELRGCRNFPAPSSGTDLEILGSEVTMSTKCMIPFHTPDRSCPTSTRLIFVFTLFPNNKVVFALSTENILLL